MLGLVERSRAYSTVHEGAIYLHLGESFLVRELNLTTLHAVVEPFNGNWYTQAKKDTMTQIVEPRRIESAARPGAHFGEIEVTEQVVGYERKTISSQERIEVVPLELPPTTFATEAIWYLPEPHHLAELDEMPKLLGTLHAAEHALIAILPLWAMCDRWDIGGLSTNIHPQTGRPTVFIYDGHPGGVGITERGFEQFEGWVADTAAMIRGCPCIDGCPSCVQSPKCGNLNDMLDKARRADVPLAAVSISAPPVRRRSDTTSQGGIVKYALLIYVDDADWDNLSEDEQKAIYGEYGAGLARRPGIVGGEQLSRRDTATTVRVRDGETLTTDGPFAETKEALGGFYLLEADDLDDAIAMAARIPAAGMGGAVEVRPRGGALALTRAGLPRRVGPCPRHPDRLPRRLRPRRGGRAGGVRDRRRTLAARRRCPSNPGALARRDGPQPRDRPHPPRPHARREDAPARACRRAGEDDMDETAFPDERLELVFTCCHPGPRARSAGRADAAHARRPDDRGDRPRVPRPRADDGAAARPREAEDRDGRHPVPRPRAHLLPDRLDRGARGRLPDLQRGLRRPAASSPRRRSGSAPRSRS